MCRKAVKAMTLVEVLIATLVFSIIAPPALRGLISIVEVVDMARNRDIATTDLQSMLERIKATPFDDMLARFPESDIDGPVSNLYANITGNYTLNDEHIVVTYANPSVDPLEINVTVSWQDKRTRPHGASMYTFITR